MFGKAHLPSVSFHIMSVTTGLSLKDERSSHDRDASHALRTFAAKRSIWKRADRGKTLMLSIAILLWVTFLKVGAGEITYKATNLPDVVPGEDLWHYEYQVSAFSFGVKRGFTIFFKVGDFENLQSPPPPVNADWDV